MRALGRLLLLPLQVLATLVMAGAAPLCAWAADGAHYVLRGRCGPWGQRAYELTDKVLGWVWRPRFEGPGKPKPTEF